MSLTPESAPIPPSPGVPNEDYDPVFNAPWEAKAFAIVNQLAALKHCTWSEWTQYLSSEITATEKRDPGSITYYTQWVIACEKLLADKGLLAAQDIDKKLDEIVAEQDAHHEH